MGATRRVVYRGVHVVKAEYEPDWGFVRRQLMGPQLRKAVHDVVDRHAKPYAISISPRSNDPRDQDHVHYQDSFEVHDTSTVINTMRRVATHLANTSPHAVYVEWGGRGTEARRVLGKTLDYLRGV